MKLLVIIGDDVFFPIAKTLNEQTKKIACMIKECFVKNTCTARKYWQKVKRVTEPSGRITKENKFVNDANVWKGLKEASMEWIKPHMFGLHVKTFIKNIQFAYDEGKKTTQVGIGSETIDNVSESEWASECSVMNVKWDIK